MCGIRLLLCNCVDDNLTDPPSWLLRRGPDFCGEQIVPLEDGRSVLLQSTVLQMRSQQIAQPVALGESSFLAWNGELYQTTQQDSKVLSDLWSVDTPDTTIVAKYVESVLVNADDGQATLESLRSVFETFVNAEYSFCLLTVDGVFYGRDRIGRRSLLRCETKEGHFVGLASVAETTNVDENKWNEVSPGLIFYHSWISGLTISLPLADTIVHVEANLNVTQVEPIPSAIQVSESMWEASYHFQHILSKAVQRRLSGDAAILFSGGLDSVVLAALALRQMPLDAEPLTLINVSFTDYEVNGDSAPPSADTLAAIASYQDLLKLFPVHKINFVQKAVDWKDMVAAEEHVRSLIFPKATVMDLNIATALWFAAGAVTPRILLTGLGADEQMGGYGRHRKAWTTSREQGLRAELDMDMSRLWDRNLGRDDRIFSDHGKEARFPYLDSEVVQFLRALPLRDVCDFSLSPGEGDKRILRVLAFRLGLTSASSAVKRAIQFGSRIAHVSDKRRFGSRRKAFGEATS